MITLYILYLTQDYIIIFCKNIYLTNLYIDITNALKFALFLKIKTEKSENIK